MIALPQETRHGVKCCRAYGWTTPW